MKSWNDMKSGNDRVRGNDIKIRVIKWLKKLLLILMCGASES